MSFPERGKRDPVLDTNVTMLNLYQSLSHSKWDCKYHVIFIPKYRKKVIFGKIRKNLGKTLHALAQMKECRILEGNAMLDHIHMIIEIPPKYAVASVIGFLKGKSAIAIARESGRQRNFSGEHFWARGYAVSTIGFELDQIKKYVKEQEEEEQQSETGKF
jgi:putative transposase